MVADFRPAERGSAKPLIGLFSQSGCGKTYSALMAARGFVGPTGRIGMIDTESGRGEAYADPREYPEFAGSGKTNYDVLPLHDDFSPTAYGEAIKKAEQAKFDALLIDSGSHEWEGPGGVLDMAAKNAAGGTKGVLVWQQPKILHKREFMLKLMQTPIPLVILCLRAKYPMEKKGNEWVRSGDLEPIQADDILFEMFVHGWIDQAHNFHLTKTTSRALEKVFTNNKPVTLETGKALARWAAGADLPKDAEPDDEAVMATGRNVAKEGTSELQGWWLAQPVDVKRRLEKFKNDVLKPIAAEADANRTVGE